MAWRSIQARLGVIQGSRYHPCFNIKSDGNTKGVVFFMHGLGDMGMGWAQLFAMQAHSNVRYVFPSVAQTGWWYGRQLEHFPQI